MQQPHTPRIDARYWTAIILASVFGTNMGDLYAHESGLGLVKGLAVLALMTALVFALEHFAKGRNETYYWLVIVLIRTGATNIADYLAYRVRVPPVLLTSGLLVLIAVFGWATHRSPSGKDDRAHALPNTNAAYWLAMLGAGVFGTVAGDLCEHRFGEGLSAIALTLIFLCVLLAGRGRAAQVIALYWTTVTIARTAGTAIGDWLAENNIVHIGLPVSTLLSGLTLLAVLLLWQRRVLGTAFEQHG